MIIYHTFISLSITKTQSLMFNVSAHKNLCHYQCSFPHIVHCVASNSYVNLYCYSLFFLLLCLQRIFFSSFFPCTHTYSHFHPSQSPFFFVSHSQHFTRSAFIIYHRKSNTNSGSMNAERLNIYENAFNACCWSCM